MASLFITPLGTRRSLNPDGAAAREARKLERDGYRREAGALRLADSQRRIAGAGEPETSAGRYSRDQLGRALEKKVFGSRLRSLQSGLGVQGARGVQGAVTTPAPTATPAPNATPSPTATPAPNAAPSPTATPTPAPPVVPAAAAPQPDKARSAFMAKVESMTAGGVDREATIDELNNARYSEGKAKYIVPDAAGPGPAKGARERFIDEVLKRSASSTQTRRAIADEMNAERYAQGQPAFTDVGADLVARTKAQSKYENSDLGRSIASAVRLPRTLELERGIQSRIDKSVQGYIQDAPEAGPAPAALRPDSAGRMAADAARADSLIAGLKARTAARTIPPNPPIGEALANLRGSVANSFSGAIPTASDVGVVATNLWDAVTGPTVRPTAGTVEGPPEYFGGERPVYVTPKRVPLFASSSPQKETLAETLRRLRTQVPQTPTLRK